MAEIISYVGRDEPSGNMEANGKSSKTYEFCKMKRVFKYITYQY